RGSMKVLVLTPPLGDAGGIQRYTLTLARALREILGKENVRCVTMSDATERNAQGKFRAWTKWRFVWQALWEALRWRPDLTICTHLSLAPLGQAVSHLFRRRPYWTVVH